MDKRSRGVNSQSAPLPRDKIHSILIHIMEPGRDRWGNADHVTHCGAKLFKGPVLEEFVGPLVNCEDMVRIRNATEADAALWVYYKVCQPCADEQINRLGANYWKMKDLRDLADTDL